MRINKEIEYITQFINKEEINAFFQGRNDAKAGLPCDASKTRVTANYFGKFVNDYYKGYKLGEARNIRQREVIREFIKTQKGVA